MKIDKACEEWLEGQRILYIKLRTQLGKEAPKLSYEANGKVEFIELIQEFIEDGVVEVKKGIDDSLFIQHIQAHLKPNEEVICKICGKTVREIIKESEGK